jgi:hypothetical protein
VAGRKREQETEGKRMGGKTADFGFLAERKTKEQGRAALASLVSAFEDK